MEKLLRPEDSQNVPYGVDVGGVVRSDQMFHLWAPWGACTFVHTLINAYFRVNVDLNVSNNCGYV